MAGLFVFVEGDRDARFFNFLSRNLLEINNRYDFIKIIEYSKMPDGKINNFIRSIQMMNAEYLFIADLDENICITSKKDKLLNKYQLDSQKIFIVILEIESWFIAGLDDKCLTDFKIKKISNTEGLNKEKFRLLMKNTKFDSEIDFMIEIMNNFSFETAKKKNKSFKYFIEKLNF